MSNTIMEKLVVESVTQYGVRSKGKNYGISPRLKEKGIEPNSFIVGMEYEVEVYTGPKGGKSINGFSLVTPTTTIPTVMGVPVPPLPTLPTTTVTNTTAPGGVPPVTPAQKRNDQDDEKMTKADWARKDANIGIDAVIKSSLESPALAQMVVGKNDNEAFDLSRRYIKFNLETQRLAKSGNL